MRRVGPGLWRDVAGVSMIEFALCLPILLTLTLYLVELGNYMLAREQVSQLALQVSDNASRIGSQNTVQTVIDEQQINDLFSGANLQGGGLNMLANGRIILSSLEVDPVAPNGQYIHWQRCYGNLAYASHYGIQGTGKGTTSLVGVGPPGALVQATSTIPVMFVEIGYQYKPIITSSWVPTQIITEISSLMVRDNRDTSGAGINPVAGVVASTC
jgi:hypothetical protein